MDLTYNDKELTVYLVSIYFNDGRAYPMTFTCDGWIISDGVVAFADAETGINKVLAPISSILYWKNERIDEDE